MISEVRDALTNIYETHGELTPELVVTEASSHDHPLHDRFDWNDTTAGQKYREVQAAKLIRSVRVEFRAADGEPMQTRQFVAPRLASEPHRYMPVGVAMADDFTRQLVLRQFERDVSDLKRRYGHLVEYAAIMRKHIA